MLADDTDVHESARIQVGADGGHSPGGGCIR